MKINRRDALRYGIAGSLLAVVGCSGNEYNKQFPGIENWRFLNISSFEEAEQKLRQHAINGDNEKIWFSDGEVWVDLSVRNPGTMNINVQEEFIKGSKKSEIYFYHQHKALCLDEGITKGLVKDYRGISPPSSANLLIQLLIKRKVNNYGKNLVSRIVDPWGVWEFDLEDRPDIPSEEKIGFNDYHFYIPMRFTIELSKTLEGNKNLSYDLQAEKLKPIYEKQGAKISYRLFNKK